MWAEFVGLDLKNSIRFEKVQLALNTSPTKFKTSLTSLKKSSTRFQKNFNYIKLGLEPS